MILKFICLLGAVVCFIACIAIRESKGHYLSFLILSLGGLISSSTEYAMIGFDDLFNLFLYSLFCIVSGVIFLNKIQKS